MGRIVICLLGAAAAAYGATTLIGVDVAGFPDGYVSPYDRTTLIAVIGLAFTLLMLGLLLLARATFRGASGLDAVFAALAILVAVAIGGVERCAGWDACARAYQAITGASADEGAGG